MRPSIMRRSAVLGVIGLIGPLALVTMGTPAAAAPGTTAVHNPLLKEVLAEEEEPDADDPAQSALCQSYLGHPNPYRNPAPNVDQIVNDTVVPVGSQQGCSAAQNETTIAVNPRNPNNIVAGANDYRLFNARENRNDSSSFAYTSFNGGRTWANVEIPGLTIAAGGTGAFSWFDGSGDPVVAFGPNNTVYFASIVFSRSAPLGGQDATAIVVNVSHDGGLHWGGPHVVAMDGVNADGTPAVTHIFNDKPWMAADPSSGRVYVSWTRFTYDTDDNYLESPIMLSASADFGAHFGAPVRIPPSLNGFHGGITPYDQGSNPQVGNDGKLYVAYEASVCATAACDAAGDRDATVVATSTDHGRTFRHAIVDTNYDFPDTLTGENFRLNSYPQLAYDRVNEKLTVVWSDDRNGLYDATTGASVKTNGDNVVSSSGNGKSWSRPLVIGTPQDEFFSAVAARYGKVAVTSYTRHYDPNGINLDYVYWAASGTQSLKRAGTQRITTASQNPQVQFLAVDPDGTEVQGVFIGDYSAVAIGNDLRIHPCWTDFRGRPGVNTPNQDAYTQSIQLRH
ncbi:sialidase family protein [Kribbella sp. NPDC051586]|uniref:sialidase family protein n=1 Tax=Kribbella sp. NPDC051586 TaxID=3364118 RepID=UPI00379B16D2